MIDCKNCKFYIENSFRCEKIKSYDGTAFLSNYSSGASYALPSVDNKEGNCEFYKRSYLNTLINFLDNLIKT